MRVVFGQFIKSKIFTLILLLAIVVVFFQFTSPGFSFLSAANIKSILDSMVIYILFAIGSGMLIIAGYIDLSPGFVGVFAGIMLGSLLSGSGIPWYAAAVLCLAAGAVFGLLNAFLIDVLHIQAFIATLATGSFIAKGVAMIMTNGKVVSISDPAIVWIGTGKLPGGIPVAIILSLALMIIFGVILAKTKFGRSIYLCGGNKTAARFAGLNPRKLCYILFAINGAFGALAGVIYSGRMLIANFTSTSNYAFPAITAAILGGISFGGGSGGMLGCFLGLLIINSFNNGLTILSVPPYWQSVFSGVLLLLALTFDYLSVKNKMRVKPAKLHQNLKCDTNGIGSERMEKLDKNKPINKIFGNKNFALFAVWVVVLVLFEAINRNYLTPGNIKSMFNTAFNTGMLAVGLSCLLISGAIDLSTGYTAMLGGVVVAFLLKAEIPWVPALLITLALGAFVGLINAFFVNVLNFPSFISTLAVGTALYGIVLVITKAQVVPINNESFFGLGTNTLLKVIPIPFLITVILMLIYGFILQRTRFGRRIYIVGGNHQAARLAGINPKKITTVLFINNSCIACLVGALVSARMRMGSPSSNIGSDLDAITAAVLGGVSFMGGIGGMSSAFIGVMLLTCFKNGLQLVGLGTYYQTVATGALLISALALDYFREKSRLKSLKSGGKERLNI